MVGNDWSFVCLFQSSPAFRTGANRKLPTPKRGVMQDVRCSPEAAAAAALLLTAALFTRFLVMGVSFVILQHTALLQLFLKSLQCAV